MKDTFHAYLVEGARFSENYEFPELSSCNEIPNGVVSFSKSFYENDFSKFVHFYENDEKIIRLWNCPKKYLQHLKKFAGVITPDFSVFCDMPRSLQIAQTYKNRALAFWLSANGIKIIPNVRYADERSYDFCFEGLPQNAVIAIGFHGNVKQKLDIDMNIKGLDETIKRLKPKTVLIYGSASIAIVGSYKLNGTEFVFYPSETSVYYASAKARTKDAFQPKLIFGEAS